MRKITFFFACLTLVIPCQAETIIVDQNGFADFDNIQDAINYSWHGDTVIVRPGTYEENIFFNGRAITLTSVDPNVVGSTIITTNDGHTVTFDFGEDGNSVLRGFTITNIDNYESGILCYASSPTITKNIISDCSYQGIKGEYAAAPTISFNIVTSNDGEGIIFCDGLISNNIISNNSYSGLHGCNGLISNNIISNNSGNGLSYCNGLISNNIISNNSYSGLSGGNGLITNNIISNNGQSGLSEGNGLITNNIISNNSGNGLSYGIGKISNNTIVGNKDSGIYSCAGQVINNIIAYNQEYGIYSSYNNSYNTLWMNSSGSFGGGAKAGVGDIAVNPLFALDGYWDNDTWIDGDYHLKSAAGRWNPNTETWVIDGVTSRCIDSGDPNSDWTAELWPHGKRINMGAYGGTPEASMSLSEAGNIADLNNNNLVDYIDLMAFVDKWLCQQVLLPEDLDRNGAVNFVDFAIFANNWLAGL